MKINEFLRNIKRIEKISYQKYSNISDGVEAVYIRQLKFDELIHTLNKEDGNVVDYVLVCKYGLMTDNDNIYTVDEINTIFTNHEIINLASIILEYTLNYHSMDTINNFLFSEENKDVILNHFSLFKEYFRLAPCFDDLTFLQFLFFQRGMELFNHKMEEEYPEMKSKNKKNKANNSRGGGFVKNSKLYKETNKA
jgi:hypothetical protein